MHSGQTYQTSHNWDKAKWYRRRKEDDMVPVCICFLSPSGEKRGVWVTVSHQLIRLQEIHHQSKNYPNLISGTRFSNADVKKTDEWQKNHWGPVKNLEWPLKYVLFNLYFAEKKSKSLSFPKRMSLTSENCCLGNFFLTGTMLVTRQMFLLKCLCSSELAPAFFLRSRNIHGSWQPTETAKDWEKEERESGAKCYPVYCKFSISDAMKTLKQSLQSTFLSTLNCWKRYFLFEGSDDSYSHPSNKQTQLFPYHEYAERPPVCTLCVSSSVDHLWGHILYCPTEWIRSLVVVNGFFTETKI